MGWLQTRNPVLQIGNIELGRSNRRGLQDIRLVVPEQGGFTPDILGELVKSRKLLDRIGVFSMHDYASYSREQYAQVLDVVRESSYADRRLWFGEFGDLDQTGEKEGYVGWWMASRLMDHLEAGFHASLSWDAYDNYHDHDEAWTIYGLLRTGLRMFTPKKRYYALKQVYRFVPPRFVRVEAVCDSPEIRALAFVNQERSQLSVVGMNLSSSRSFYLNVDSPVMPGSLQARKVAYFRTTETENCARFAEIPVRGQNWPFTGIEAPVPPDCIFTLTTL